MDDIQVEMLNNNLNNIAKELFGIREGINDLTTALLSWLQASIEQNDREEKNEEVPLVTARDLYLKRNEKKINSLTYEDVGV